MELDWQSQRFDTKSSLSYQHRISESFVRSPQLVRFETTSSPLTFRRPNRVLEVGRMTTQGKYTTSFGQILESTYQLLEEIKSGPKQSLAPTLHHPFKSSDARLSANSVFNQTYRSPLKMSTTQSDFRGTEEMMNSYGKKSGQKGPKRNAKLIIDESYKLINEIKAGLQSSKINFDKVDHQVESFVYRDPLRSPDSQVNIGTHMYTESGDERSKSRVYYSKDKISQIGRKMPQSNEMGSGSMQSFHLEGKPAHSYNISINNENVPVFSGGQKKPVSYFQKQEKYEKQGSPNQEEEGGSMTKDELRDLLPHHQEDKEEVPLMKRKRDTSQKGQELRVEEVTEVISRVKNNPKNNKGGSSEIYIVENGRLDDHDQDETSRSYRKESIDNDIKKPQSKAKLGAAGHIKIELDDQVNRGVPSQVLSQMEIPEERPKPNDTDSEDIGAVLGFSKEKNQNDLSAKKVKKFNSETSEDFPMPNEALNLNPQPKPQVQNEKITLTITSYKPKPLKESKANLQKSYDGLKNSIRSIDVGQMEKSVDNFGGSTYSSGYHISSDSSNLRNSRSLKKETANLKTKPSISPKAGQPMNQRYFQPKVGAGKAFYK